MLSDRNIVSIIWQVSKTLPVVRQERQMVVLPPFVNYSLVNSMLEPVALGNTAVLIPDYRPEKLGEYISKYKGSITKLVGFRVPDIVPSAHVK